MATLSSTAQHGLTRAPLDRRLPLRGLLGRPPVGPPVGDDGVRAAYAHAFRNVLGVAVAARLLALLPPILAVARAGGVTWPDTAVLVVAVAGLVALAQAWRRAGPWPGAVGPALIGDLVLVSGLATVSAALPGPAAGADRHLLLPLIASVVAVYAVAWGAVGGGGAVTAAVPVQLLAAHLDVGRGPVAGPVLVGTAWLALALGAALAALAALVRQTRAAASFGIRFERTRMLRLLHDTALQCLEVMSLQSTADDADPAAAVAELRATARAEVARMRTALHGATAAGGPAAGLGEVVVEAVARGLQIDLISADVDDVSVTDARRDAVCGATAAALSNVRRHAGVTRATVRLDRAVTGIEVTIRDHGVGFPAGTDHFGFGIRESVLARVREVGGRASVVTAPGAGTRVTLWVPGGPA